MKKLLSIFAMVLFVGVLAAQEEPKKAEAKSCEKAKTECTKAKAENKKDAKASCDKAKVECKKEDTKTTAEKK